MSIFGNENKQQNYLRGKQKAEIEKRVKCQEEINKILEKYGLAIRATFQLVEVPKQPKQPKEI